MRKISSVTDTADANGEFTEGNVAQGVSPTTLKADIFNTWQRELVNLVVNGGGLALDPKDDGQVLKALEKLFLKTNNNFSEISDAGADSQKEARSNIKAASISGDPYQGFSVAGGTLPNSAVAYNQFQSGNNGNGAWVKLAGGGQWCRQNLSIPANSTVTWTFPAAFVSTPALFFSTFNGAPSVWFNGASSTGANLFNASNSAINVNILAMW